MYRYIKYIFTARDITRLLSAMRSCSVSICVYSLFIDILSVWIQVRVCAHVFTGGLFLTPFCVYSFGRNYSEPVSIPTVLRCLRICKPAPPSAPLWFGRGLYGLDDWQLMAAWWAIGATASSDTDGLISEGRGLYGLDGAQLVAAWCWKSGADAVVVEVLIVLEVDIVLQECFGRFVSLKLWE